MDKLICDTGRNGLSVKYFFVFTIRIHFRLADFFQLLGSNRRLYVKQIPIHNWIFIHSVLN